MAPLEPDEGRADVDFLSRDAGSLAARCAAIAAVAELGVMVAPAFPGGRSRGADLGRCFFSTAVEVVVPLPVL